MGHPLCCVALLRMHLGHTRRFLNVVGRGYDTLQCNETRFKAVGSLNTLLFISNITQCRFGLKTLFVSPYISF